MPLIPNHSVLFNVVYPNPVMDDIDCKKLRQLLSGEDTFNISTSKINEVKGGITLFDDP